MVRTETLAVRVSRTMVFEALGIAGAAARVARLAGLEPTVARRLAIANLVIWSIDIRLGAGRRGFGPSAEERRAACAPATVAVGEQRRGNQRLR